MKAKLFGLDPARKRAKAVAYNVKRPIPEREPETYSPYPVLGWRAWSLTPDDGRGDPRGSHDPRFCPVCRAAARRVLTGAYGKTWPGAYLQAECHCSSTTRGLTPHTIPDWSALCGIYATKAHPNERPLGHTFSVLGLVALSDVIEHEHGYRAAEARILALACDLTVLDALRASYPDIDICRSPVRLWRVWDYYTRNPDQIPPVQHPELDERNPCDADRKATTPYPADEGARHQAHLHATYTEPISSDYTPRPF